MKESIESKANQLRQVYQNLIIGTITGSLVGYIVQNFYQKDMQLLAWGIVSILGAVIGLLSGLERERYERLKEEKILLEVDFDKIQRMFRQTENKYRLIMDNLSDAVYLTTEKGQFLLFNETTCLLSGYFREELKNMTLAQIQLEDEMTEEHQKAWLDNGICRYEENWKTKSGEVVHLDISARWLKISNVQCILHVARDIEYRKKAYEEKRAQELLTFEKKKLEELSNTLLMMNKHFLAPAYNWIEMLVREIKGQPRLEEKIKPVLAEWEKSQKQLHVLTAKLNRNFEVSPINFNLNDVLRQELFFLALTTGSDEFLRQAKLSPDLPLVFGSGQVYSLILGALFRALMASVDKSGRKNVVISTLIEEGAVVVRIHAPSATQFDYHLTKVLDPSFSEKGGNNVYRGWNTLNLLLKPQNHILEMERFEPTGIAIKLKILTESSSHPYTPSKTTSNSIPPGKEPVIL